MPTLGVTPMPPLLRPFIGERYAKARDLSALISPPYDVISPIERSMLGARDPANIAHLILPEGSEDRYERAASLLKTWRRGGTLQRDAGPTVSVLRQQFTTPDGRERVRTGLIAAVCAESYALGRVRPHERTAKAPKEDRLRLVRATRTVLEPLFFLSRDTTGGLADFLRIEMLRSPDTEAMLADVRLSVWVVTADRAQGALASLQSEPLYIADGHHRYETAAAYAAEQPGADWTMGLVVGAHDPGLVVLPTHRVIVGGRAERSTLEGIVAAVGEPGVHDCTVVWPDGTERCVRLRRDGAPEATGIALVERLLIAPLVAADAGSRLVYTHDEHDARARAAGGGVAVLVGPTPLTEVLAVADAGGTMPPKSTFFYPKVPSGLVLGPLA